MAPAVPPTTAPMIAPLAVEPVWLPITPPTAPPAAAPIIAPSSFLFRLAHALAPRKPTTRSTISARSRCVYEIFMYGAPLKTRERSLKSGANCAMGSPAVAGSQPIPRLSGDALGRGRIEIREHNQIVSAGKISLDDRVNSAASVGNSQC